MRSTSISPLYFAAINTNTGNTCVADKPFKSPFLKAIITGASGMFSQEKLNTKKEEKKQATLLQLFADNFQRG